MTGSASVIHLCDRHPSSSHFVCSTVRQSHLTCRPLLQGCRPVSGREWTITKLGRDPMGRAVVAEVALEAPGSSGATCSPMEALQADISSLRLQQQEL